MMMLSLFHFQWIAAALVFSSCGFWTDAFVLVPRQGIKNQPTQLRIPRFSKLPIEVETTTATTTTGVEKKVPATTATDDSDSNQNDNKRISSSSSNDMVVGLQHFVRDNLFFGIFPSADIVAVVSIYFVEGALGLASLAETFLLKDELHLGPAEMSAITGLFAIPWTVKPLYGFLTDGFPLFGYRRRSYLTLVGILGTFSYLALKAQDWFDITSSSSSSSSLEIPFTIASLILGSACVAFSDVVADGIVVEKSRDDPIIAAGLQSLCWQSRSVGGLISAYFSGSLLEQIGPRDVFGLTALLPFMVAVISNLIDEPRVVVDDESESKQVLETIKEQVQGLWDAVRLPTVWKPALFLFLWQSTPTSEGAFLYFLTNDLHFGPEFLGRVRLVTEVAALVGVWGYQTYLRNVPIKSILFWTSIISTPLGLSSLLLITHANRAIGIPDGAFVFGDDVALTILGRIAFLPTLVLAARICPAGMEAVLFATLMSIFNGASILGTEIGAALTKFLGVTETNFDNLALLNVVCNLSSLYPLLLLGWLDDVGGSKSEQELEQMDNNNNNNNNTNE